MNELNFIVLSKKRISKFLKNRNLHYVIILIDLSYLNINFKQTGKKF